MHLFLTSQKILSIFLLGLIMLFTILQACSENKEIPSTKNGQVSFVITGKTPDGRVSEDEVPNEIKLTLKNEREEEVSEVVSVMMVDGQLSSSPIALEVGNYELMSFVIVSNANEALYAAPVASSDLSQFVDKPLPFSFEVSTERAAIEVEVLQVGGNDPSDFGLVEFPVTIVETKPLFIKTFIATATQPETITFSLELTATDSSDMSTWEKTWEVTNEEIAFIPTGYDRYDFTVSRAGHISHHQFLDKQAMRESSSLYFELIDEEDVTEIPTDTSKPIIVRHMFGENLDFTLYYTSDPTIPWIRLVNNNAKNIITYFDISRTFFNNNGDAIAYDEVFALYGEDQKSSVGRVNEVEFAMQHMNTLIPDLPYVQAIQHKYEFRHEDISDIYMPFFITYINEKSELKFSSLHFYNPWKW
ncbi:MAG: hypothetical protein ABJG47_01625 [Ekhidna sp.]